MCSVLTRTMCAATVAAFISMWVLPGGSAALADVIIDDFEAGSLYLSDPTPGAGTEFTDQTLGTSNVAGGVRSLENYGTNSPSVMSLTLTGGDDAITMTSRTTSYFNFIYDGGSGYMDLDLSGHDRFELTFPRVDSYMWLNITLRSGNTFPQTGVPIKQSGVLVVPFSSFGAPDWSDIDRIVLEFTTSGYYSSPAHVEALSDFRAVPEPATLTLLALAAPVLIRRRRRRR